MFKEKSRLKKAGLLAGCALLILFCCLGFAFQKPEKALAAEISPVNEKQVSDGEQVQPRFGGKDTVTLKFVDPSEPNVPFYVDITAYAENYGWPMSDRGHFSILGYAFDFTALKLEYKITMQFAWPEGVADGSTVLEQGVYPYNTEIKVMEYAKNHCKTASGRKFTAWSCYQIIVTFEGSYNGGPVQTVILKPTF